MPPSAMPVNISTSTSKSFLPTRAASKSARRRAPDQSRNLLTTDNNHADQIYKSLSCRAALRRRALPHVQGARRRRLRCGDRRHHRRQRADRLGRDGAARQFLLAGLRRRRARRRRRDRTAPDRPGSARARPDRPADGHGVQGPSLHQVGARHGLLGSRRARRRRAAGDLARRPRERDGGALQGRHPRPGRGDGRQRASEIVAQGFGRLQVKVGGDVRDDIERVSAVAARCRNAPSSSATPMPAGRRSRRCSSPMRRATSTTRSSSPAPRIEENLSVRRAFDKPMVLDESVTSLEDMLDDPPQGRRRRADAEDLAARRRRPRRGWSATSPSNSAS